MPELTNHGCINSKSSSLELSWPVDVRNHVHLPYGGMPIISTLRIEPYPVKGVGWGGGGGGGGGGGWVGGGGGYS